jgi:hypothetical protein
MAIPGTITLSYTFGPLSGSIPLSYLDTNYSTIVTAVNGIFSSANVWTYQQTPVSGTAAVSTTTGFAYDPPTHGQVCVITMTNAITVTFNAPTNIVLNTMYKWVLKAGDTSARTYAWNSAFKFPGATASLTSGTVTSGAVDVISFLGGAGNTLIYQGSTADVR